MALIITFANLKLCSRRGQPFAFNLGCHTIVICTDIRYIDVIFSHNMHFYQTGNIIKFIKLGRKLCTILTNLK